VAATREIAEAGRKVEAMNRFNRRMELDLRSTRGGLGTR